MNYLRFSAIVILIATFSASAYSDDTDHDVKSFLDSVDPNQRLRVSHVHGAGFVDEDLIVATHLGLIRYNDLGWEPVDSPPHDFMGFSLVDDGAYISGHPSVFYLDELDNPLGIMFTGDLGENLEPRGYAGEVDFHWLSAGYFTSSIYALTPKEPSTGAPLFAVSSDKGTTWESRSIQGTNGSLVAIAAHPTKSRTVYILTSDGLYVSGESGGVFIKIASYLDMKTLGLSRDGETIYLGGSRLLALDSSGRLKRELRVPEIEANDVIREIASGPKNSRILAYITGFRHVYLSNNNGRTWDQIMVAGDATH
jgi:hypothetical protein